MIVRNKSFRRLFTMGVLLFAVSIFLGACNANISVENGKKEEDGKNTENVENSKNFD